MRVYKQYGPRPAALLLAAAVLLQVFCPGGLLAAETGGSHPASHGGCHGSSPQNPYTPPSQQKCCAVTPVAEPSFAAGYATPTPAMAEHLSGGQLLQTAERLRVSSIQPLVFHPPGFLILRI